MVTNSKANQEFSYAILVVLRRMFAAIVLAATLYGTTWVYGVPFDEPYQALTIIAVLVSLLLFSGKPRDPDILSANFWNISLSVIGRWSLLVGILLLLGYATKTSSIFSRRALFTWILITPVLLIFAQLIADVFVSRFLLSAGKTKRVVIAGANELGHELAAKIHSSPMHGMQVDGFFDDRGADRLPSSSSIPLLGKLQDLPDHVHRNKTDLIFVVLPIRNIQRVTDLLDRLHDTTASLYFVPDVFVFDLIQCRTSEIGGLPVVALCETPFQGTQGIIKTVSDYVIASLVLILASPIMLGISAAIKLTSPGSVIFKQRRYGLDGHEIIVYKFRSMRVSEDSDIVKQATKDDDRVTKIGAFLRRTSLDELPQFINVLQGRMSVVGPRPHAVAHNEEYRQLIKGYMIRHKVNPGITGLAQVMGYRGETATVDAMKKRVEYDLEYLRKWSLSLDLRILFRTLRVAFTDEKAY